MTSRPKKIYVASSWRNEYQPKIVETLRQVGHEVYDFRNPRPGNDGFRWSAIDPNWKDWTPKQFSEALIHPIAQDGYRNDKEGIDWCTHCILVLPAGVSAALEAGWVAGSGRPTSIFMPQLREPELMFKLFEDPDLPFPYHLTVEHMLEWLELA